METFFKGGGRRERSGRNQKLENAKEKWYSLFDIQMYPDSTDFERFPRFVSEI